EAEARAGAQQRQDVVPHRRETIGAEMCAQPFRDDRRVVVAQIPAEPAELAHQIAALERERQDEQQIAAEIAAEHGNRLRALPAADVALPAGEPVERLERGQRARLLERAPLALDRR